MQYFKALIPAVFALIIANAELVACGNCGGCCAGKNSTKAIEAAMKDASWLSDWMAAKKYVKEKDFVKGIESYTNAIWSLEHEEARTLSFGLFNERAAAYMAVGDIDKAIFDYTYIISEAENVSQDVLDARLGRVNAYVKAGKEKKCREDIDYLTKYDPNFPKISRKGDFLVISNFNDDQMKKKDIKAFKKFHVKLGLCESIEDIVFLPNKKYIVKTPLNDKAALQKLVHVYAGLLKRYNPKISFPSSMLNFK